MGSAKASVVVRGALAGAVGTAAMTAAQKLAARIRSADESAHGGDADPWRDAPAPAQAGKRILEGAFGVSVPAERIGLLTNAMHWIYGTGWGIVYAVLEESLSARPSSRGALFGAGVWATSYLTLVPMGIYEPPWRYPAGELGLDASYHLVYGTTVARLYRAAART